MGHPADDLCPLMSGEVMVTQHNTTNGSTANVQRDTTLNMLIYNCMGCRTRRHISVKPSNLNATKI